MSFLRFLFGPRLYWNPFILAVLLIFLMKGVHKVGLLTKIQPIVAEGTLLLGKKNPPKRVVTAELDNEEYDSKFEGKSRLKPEGLKDLLKKVLDTHPRVLVVDIDTAHEGFRKVSELK